jgi:hypothetical protein
MRSGQNPNTHIKVPRKPRPPSHNKVGGEAAEKNEMYGQDSKNVLLMDVPEGVDIR